MKHLYLIVCLLHVYCVAGQVGTPITGRLARWGALQQDEQIVGHYSVTAVPDAELEAEIFTLSLFDADLTEIGSKSFPARTDFSVEDVAYNGTHLGVLLQEDGVAKVELLDGAATTVASYPLRSPKPKASGSIIAAHDGFLVLSEFPTNPRHPASSVNYQVEYLPTSGKAEGWSRSFGNPKLVRQSTFVELMGVDEEVLLLRARDEATVGTTSELASSLHAIDLATGQERFGLTLPADEPHLATQVAAARRCGEEIRVVTNSPDYATKRNMYRGTTELLAYDMEGGLLSRRTLDLPGAVSADDGRIEYVVQSVAFTESGNLSLVAESIRREKNKINCVGQLVFGFDGGGQFQAVLPLERPPLTMPAYFLGRGGAGLFGPQVKDQRLAYFLGMHGGPFNHALSEQQNDGVLHYFWDRSFHDFTVEYRGIRAVRYRDGQFEQEYIPLQETDIAWLSSARSGYLLVIEPRAEGGLLLPRLEKLNF